MSFFLLKSNFYVLKDKFEIKGDTVFGSQFGPMNSRQTSRRLFENYEFLFIGEFSPNFIDLQDLIQLARLNGAVVRNKAKEFSDGSENKIRVVFFDETVRKISAKNAQQMLLISQVHCVNKTWLVDSLACFKIREMKDYQTYDTDNSKHAS